MTFQKKASLSSDYLDAEESFAVEDPIDICEYRQEAEVLHVARGVEVFCEEDSELVSEEYYEDEVADDGCDPDPALAGLDAFLELVDLFDEQYDVEHADRHER